jgi:hypothetical protein
MCCANQKSTGKANSLAELVKQFLEQERCCPCDEIEMEAFCDRPIEAVIEKAAAARDNNGNFYRHQWNLEKKKEHGLAGLIGIVRIPLSPPS